MPSSKALLVKSNPISLQARPSPTQFEVKTAVVLKIPEEGPQVAAGVQKEQIPKDSIKPDGQADNPILEATQKKIEPTILENDHDAAKQAELMNLKTTRKLPKPSPPSNSPGEGKKPASTGEERKDTQPEKERSTGSTAGQQKEAVPEKPKKANSRDKQRSKLVNEKPPQKTGSVTNLKPPLTPGGLRKNPSFVGVAPPPLSPFGQSKKSIVPPSPKCRKSPNGQRKDSKNSKKKTSATPERSSGSANKKKVVLTRRESEDRKCQQEAAKPARIDSGKGIMRKSFVIHKKVPKPGKK